MNNAINITGLSHSFGKHQVLKDLNLKIPAGSIYGFLGRNGAGKTTCIRILAGLLGRQSGEVSVLGHDPLLLGSSTTGKYRLCRRGRNAARSDECEESD